MDVEAVDADTWGAWSPADRWELVELYRDVLVEDAPYFGQTPDQRGLEFLTLFDAWLAASTVTYWLGRLDGAVVCGLRVHHHHPMGQLIEALHTRASHRGHGLASELVRHVVLAYPRQEVWAEVELANHASRKVMSSCGFREAERGRDSSMWVHADPTQ